MTRLHTFLICLLWLCLQHASAFDLTHGQKVRISMPAAATSQSAVANTALTMLGEDLQKVLSAELKTVSSAKKADILCTIDSSLPKEGFSWQITDKQLRITAADPHGLAYGMMELSRRMGVSPWEDWADATPSSLDALHLDGLDNTTQSPKVAFRGIFINDEDWGLNPWATRQEPEALVMRSGQIKGAIGPKVTERIFRLMLRLRLNYYWPPMHECTQPFFLTPGNREVAARYGIYIGGSHCEPMASSAAAEWGIRGNGDYNYVTNAARVRQFWQERLDSVKNQEILYTLGMRGVHDGAMQGVKTKDDKLRYLQQVIDDQRSMLSNTLGRPLTDIPQVFVPYKEVLDVYLGGLRVPDDVTLMWTDDNYGYVRHYPDSTERARKGGNGIYYHVSYWGRPHDYCWLSTLSPYLMEQQLTEAYNRGIQKIWMLNVGDIKPAEVQIHVFSELAWQGVATDLTKGSRAEGMMKDMLRQIFPSEGNAFCDEAVRCLDESFRLTWDRKPEHMAGTRVEESDKAYWNVVRPIDYWTNADVERRINDYSQLSATAQQLSAQVRPEHRDAFFQLVQYPIQAAALMNQKYLCPSFTQQAQDSIHVLTRVYNKGIANGGKWDGIMSDAPRGLRVFQPLSASDVPSYDNTTASRHPLLTSPAPYSTVLQGLGTKGWMLATPRDKEFRFPISIDPAADSITLAIHLLPTMPIDTGRLQFTVSLDPRPSTLDPTPSTLDPRPSPLDPNPSTLDPRLSTISFETYDRSEDWKRNVLRNCSERIVTLPVKKGATNHTITFKALSDNVILDQIYQIEK